MAPEPGDALDRAMALVSFLREHCPWDGRQTPRTLVKHLVEETHEVVDAILGGTAEELNGELGDLLLNLAFQLVIAEEAGDFDREAVWSALEEKMKRRHPHLFDLGEPESWEAIKGRETGRNGSALDGLPASLPPLARAFLIQRRASRVGFDWEDPAGALAKVREETDEVAAQLGGKTQVRLEEELGDLLFSVVNLARLADVDPSIALVEASRKFDRRFRIVETRAREAGLPLPGTALDVLDRIWDEAKAVEARSTEEPPEP